MNHTGLANVFGREFRRQGKEERFVFLYSVRNHLHLGHSRGYRLSGPKTDLDHFRGEVRFCRLRGGVRLSSVLG